jgi:hypothetical protein
MPVSAHHCNAILRQAPELIYDAVCNAAPTPAYEGGRQPKGHPVNTLPGPDLRGLRPPPWEERERYGSLNALVLTIRLVLLSPGRMFGQMPVGLGLVQPLLFAVALALIGALFDWMWSLTVGENLRAILPANLDRLLGGRYVTAAHFLLSPVVVVLLVFLRAAVFHGMLLLVGGNRLGFEATFRVVAYTRATRLLSILPICGVALGMIWELAVTIIGLARIHGCAEWKAIVAVLAPALLALLIGGAFGVFLAGLAAVS